MKRIILIVLILSSVSISFSQEKNTENSDLEKRIELLEKESISNKEEFQRHVSLLQHERIEYLSDYRTDKAYMLGFITLVIALAGIIVGYYQSWLIKKNAEKIYIKLAKYANTNAEALKKAIRVKAIELDLVRYPIYVVSNNHAFNSQSEELERLLKAFYFKNVYLIRYSELDNNKDFSFDNPGVVIFTKDGFDKDYISSFLSKKFQIGVLCFWRYHQVPEIELTEQYHVFVNSFANVYENLMSLLHYLRYKKNHG